MKGGPSCSSHLVRAFPSFLPSFPFFFPFAAVGSAFHGKLILAPFLVGSGADVAPRRTWHRGYPRGGAEQGRRGKRDRSKVGCWSLASASTEEGRKRGGSLLGMVIPPLFVSLGSSVFSLDWGHDSFGKCRGEVDCCPAYLGLHLCL